MKKIKIKSISSLTTLILKERVYYQGSCIIENYSDKFQSLISEANYTNLCTIVVKFYYSLQTAI